jgi:oligopeptide/dipeptide ABC transporter ATP-binding protein
MHLAANSLLDVQNLSIAYYSSTQVGRDGRHPVHRAVRNANLKILDGETAALVGETGSGKSTLALSALGLLDPRAAIESGEILFEGRSIKSLNDQAWKEIRSQRIGIAFQDARSALNPILTIEDHLIETLRTHQPLKRKEAREIGLGLLREVGIPDGQEKFYPFELSGGACQRVGIAVAVCNSPRLLIADEPVSAIDVTLQSQILDLLRRMKQRHSLSLMLISHDLPLISQVADRIYVMYHGRIVESGFGRDIFDFPAHPYTRALIQTQPSLGHHHESNPLAAIPGSMPVPGEELPGCMFAPRCPDAVPECQSAVPEDRELSKTHRAACIRVSYTEKDGD